VLDKLIAAMRDENARIRFDAVHALGAIAEAPLPAAQLTALAAELDHYDPLIRTATCRVIGRLHAGEVADKLLIALNDSQSLVRQFAVEALGLVRADSAVPHLLSLLIRDKGAAAPQALLALARIAPASALDHFRKNLTSKQPALRRAAAEGLGRLKDRDSLAALQCDRETRATAWNRLPVRKTEIGSLGRRDRETPLWQTGKRKAPLLIGDKLQMGL